MTDKEATDILDQVVEVSQVTIKDARLIIEAWKKIKNKVNGRSSKGIPADNV